MLAKGIRATGAAFVALLLFIGFTLFANVASAHAAVSDTVSKDTEWADPAGSMNNWKKESDGKYYKYITMFADMWAANGPDYVGVSNSGLLSYGSGNITLEQAKRTSLFGIWASAANEEPNPYQANYYWNLYADSIGSDAVSHMAATISPPAWDSESGVWNTFKYRPEFVLVCNGLADATGKNCPMTYQDAIKYLNGLKYYTGEDSSGADQFSEGKSSPYYQDGDETYAPERHTVHNDTPFTYVDEFYWDAEYAEKVTAETASYAQPSSADALDYRSANKLPRTTRYNDKKPTEHALNIEKLVRGSVYYTLYKTYTGDVAKKKVAFLVDSPDATGNTVKIASFDFIEGINQNGYSPTGQQGTGTQTRYNCNGMASFIPLVVDQARGTDAQKIWRGGVYIPSTNSTSGTAYYWGAPYTTYEVSADDLQDCDVIYGVAGSMSSDELKTWMTDHMTGNAAKQKASSMLYLTTPPTVVKWANVTAEKILFGIYAINAIYPELFPNMELAAYWYDNVYHLKSDSVGAAMNYAFANASLPQGVALASDYNAASIDRKAAEGYKFYEAAQTLDPTLKRIMENRDLDGNLTSADSNLIEVEQNNRQWAYDFSAIQPTSYFKAFADASGATIDLTQKNVASTATTATDTATDATPAKQANTMQIAKASKTKTVKYAKVKKKAQSVTNVTVTKAQGTVTVKNVSTKSKVKKWKVSYAKKTGKVTVKVPKKTGKGTYTVKIQAKAAGNSSYEASKALSVSFKVKVV